MFVSCLLSVNFDLLKPRRVFLKFFFLLFLIKKYYINIDNIYYINIIFLEYNFIFDKYLNVEFVAQLKNTSYMNGRNLLIKFHL